jgi:hypothetical protein
MAINIESNLTHFLFEHIVRVISKLQIFIAIKYFPVFDLLDLKCVHACGCTPTCSAWWWKGTGKKNNYVNYIFVRKLYIVSFFKLFCANYTTDRM